jgi:hypothetical protein
MKPSVKSELTPEESSRLSELEPIIESGMRSFVDVGNALLEISDKRLYRATHSSFKEYVSTKWKMSVAHAYRLAEAAEIVSALPSPVGDTVTSERQARELKKVPAEKRAKVIKAASQDGPPTAEKIKAAALEVMPPEPPPTEPPNEPPAEVPKPPPKDSPYRHFYSGPIEEHVDEAVKDGTLEQLQSLKLALETGLQKVKHALKEKQIN